MTKKIPFFDYPALYNQNKAEYLEIIDDVCSRGAFILQSDLCSLEDELKQFLNVKHAFGVADGTNALILGLNAMGIGAGDEVIVCSHTYVASAAAIYYAGAQPVLCDIGDDNLLDPEDIERHISAKTKAVMVTQLNGRCCDMSRVQAVTDQHNLKIVEDSAQALGAKFKSQCAGTFGEFGTISFYPAKTLGCFGDGGLVMTNDETLGEKLYVMRDHGRNSEGEMVSWGTNSRLDNLQAAILNHKLKTYNADIQRRREIAGYYHDSFKDIDDLRLPPPPSEGDHFDVYQNYEFFAGERDALRAFLTEKGIGTIIQWGGTPLHQIKALNLSADLPKTDAFFTGCMMLPLHTALSDEDVQTITRSVRDFYRIS